MFREVFIPADSFGYSNPTLGGYRDSKQIWILGYCKQRLQLEQVIFINLLCCRQPHGQWSGNEGEVILFKENHANFDTRRNDVGGWRSRSNLSPY
jgi:hypothetical protein